MIKFSVIIPVYNRPEEIVELLDSLTMQSIKTEMEVIVVEDGSSRTCRSEVEQFTKQLTIKYIYQENAGPGLARNHGAEYARGEYMLFFDSDCVIPSGYFVNTLEFLSSNDLDCFGGPDRAHAFFTSVQKAISYSMTSLLTTGGIRGGRKKLDKFYPRSFNLGVKSDVFRALGGFSDMRYGEDLDFSMNAIEHGYKVGLITDTFVYHKRRNTFCSFYKQVFSSGSARVELTGHSEAGPCAAVVLCGGRAGAADAVGGAVGLAGAAGGLVGGGHSGSLVDDHQVAERGDAERGGELHPDNGLRLWLHHRAALQAATPQQQLRGFPQDILQLTCAAGVCKRLHKYATIVLRRGLIAPA